LKSLRRGSAGALIQFLRGASSGPLFGGFGCRMAPKRKASLAPSERPVTIRSQRGGIEEALLAFLNAEKFDPEVHVQAFYRLSAEDPGRATPTVREHQRAADRPRGRSKNAVGRRNSSASATAATVEAAAAASAPESIAASAVCSDAGDVLAGAFGLGSPFCAVDLNDRRGVWQSDEASTLCQQLGEDPRLQRREVLSASSTDEATEEDSDEIRKLARTSGTCMKPVGLRNLGATCYLNSLLQSLFFNVDFRRLLLRVPHSSSNAVGALQKIFAHLADGERCTVDPEEFVEAMSVNPDEQEDATEFFTLLLDWLERELSTESSPEGSTNSGAAGNGSFIPQLFQGQVSQLLVCADDVSHSFEKRENFNELRVRLADAHLNAAAHATAAEAAEASVNAAACSSSAGGAASKVVKKPRGKRPVARLEQLLLDYYRDEVMDGANQYHCPRCDRKVDARKCLRLAKLPPYLHVVIERYHYDLQKGERKKLNDAVSFPKRLELSLLQGEAAAASSGKSDTEGGADEQESSAPPSGPSIACEEVGSSSGSAAAYECIGYLEHLSNSVHSGHYTATLCQEDQEALEALRRAAPHGSLAFEDASVPGEDHDGDSMTQFLPSKRRRCGGDSAEDPTTDAEGEGSAATRGDPVPPRRWWSLDDDKVTVFEPPVRKVVPASAKSSDSIHCSSLAFSATTSAAPSTVAALVEEDVPGSSQGGVVVGGPSTYNGVVVERPGSAVGERLESSSAYMLLYRRCDVVPGQLAKEGVRSHRGLTGRRIDEPSDHGALPGPLGTVVAEANAAFRSEQSEYIRRSEAISAFQASRKSSVEALLEAFRAEDIESATSASEPPLPGFAQKDEPMPQAAEAGVASGVVAVRRHLPTEVSELAFVPARWLNAFLRGEDRTIEELLAERGRSSQHSRISSCGSGVAEGSADKSQGPKESLAGSSCSSCRAFLPHPPKDCARDGGSGDEENHLVCPLAIWNGEVKFVPSRVLEHGLCPPALAAMAAVGEEALSAKACHTAWSLFQVWRKEQAELVRIVEQGKVTVAEARKWQSKGKGDDLVWVANRVLTVWRKARAWYPDSTGQASPSLPGLWCAFLAEARCARWGSDDAQRVSPADEPYVSSTAAAPRNGGSNGEEAAAQDKSAPTASEQVADSAAELAPNLGETVLTAGLLCKHGLIGRPRSGCLVQRASLETLLKLSHEKERLYDELWSDAKAVPRLRNGSEGQCLLGFASGTCSACCGESSRRAPTIKLRTLIVRMRFKSGRVRKHGELQLPPVGAPTETTIGDVFSLVRDRMGVSVAKAFLPASSATGAEVELKNKDEPLSEAVDSILVERDDTANNRVVEAAAFEGSIFRTPQPSKTNSIEAKPVSKAVVS